jgi:hypothetical protein
VVTPPTGIPTAPATVPSPGSTIAVVYAPITVASYSTIAGATASADQTPLFVTAPAGDVQGPLYAVLGGGVAMPSLQLASTARTEAAPVAFVARPEVLSAPAIEHQSAAPASAPQPYTPAVRPRKQDRH